MIDSTLTFAISILACISSVAAAIIYYFTLKEIRKQRQTTYKPEIFVDNKQFFIKSYSDEKVSKSFFWDDKIKYDQTNNVDNVSNFSLKCYNIGLGTAKNVKIIFKIDINDFIKTINLLISDMESKIRIESKRNMISIYADEINKTITHFEINQNQQLVSFILPVSYNKKEYDFVKLPNYFMDLYTIYFYLRSKQIKESKQNNFTLDVFYNPIFSIQINFEDVHNDKHTKEFLLKFEVFSFHENALTGLINIK